MLRALLLPLVLAQAVSAVPQDAAVGPPPSRTLTLREALDTAAQHQPLMRQARATTGISRARMEPSAGGLFAAGQWHRHLSTAHREFRAFTGLTNAINQDTSMALRYDSFNFALNATQLIYDFGQTDGRWRAADATIEASRENERTGPRAGRS